MRERIAAVVLGAGTLAHAAPAPYGMPYLTPGVLTSDQVYALTAFLLHLNGVIDAHTVVTEKTLPAIRMPNRDGFVADPRPDVPRR